MAGHYAILLSQLKQLCVYWAKTGDDNYGKPTWASPVQLRCRWEDKPQEILTPDGRQVWSKGFLMLLQELLPGSIAYLGSLAQASVQPWYPGPPTVSQGGSEVLICPVAPDIQNLSTEFEAYL